MTRRVLAIGGALVLVVAIVAAAAVLQNSASRRAGGEAAGEAAGQVPLFEPDPLWSQVLPNKWTTGAVGGVDVDSHDNVWVFHRPATIADGEKGAAFDPPRAECCIPAPPVLQFSPTGEFIQAWGGPGQGYEWPTVEHGVFVDDQSS